jgi:uncharacterized protein
MEPVQLGERIEIVDILRGFALFGILCVNMQFYTTPFMAWISGAPYWPETEDRIATFAIKLLAEGKFYLLFSFLFGLGICIQLTRAEARGAGFSWHHVKRMLVLLLFGLVHAYFFWMGDILQFYALIGLGFTALLWLRPWVLGIVAAVVYVLPILFGCLSVFLGMLMGSAEGQSPEQFFQALGYPSAEEAARIYSTGTYWEIMSLRAREVFICYIAFVFEMGPDIVAMFALGFCAGKLHVFDDLPRWLGFFRRWRWPALALGLAGNLAYAAGAELARGDQASPLGLAIVIGHGLGAPALTFFYVATIVLFVQPEPAGGGLGLELFSPLAFVGRMALTNYLLQTLICTTIFYSYGFGLYASIGPLAGLGLTVLIYLAQIPFSVQWLRFFRFGPMEWLWRSLTYGKLQPMRL